MTDLSSCLNYVSDLLNRAKKAGADHADAGMFESAATSATVRMGKIEHLERAESTGFGLRVMIGKKQAVVSSTDIRKDTLDQMVERAIAMAKASPEDPYIGLADPELLADTLPELDLYDPAEPSTEWMIDTAKKAEDTALAVKGISNSGGADTSYSSNVMALATSTGFNKAYHSSSCSISACVLAGSGTAMERDYDFSSSRFVSDLTSAEEIGTNAAKYTLQRLNPRKVNSCHVPVIFDKRVSKTLVGSFSSAINGALIARGTSFLKDKMNQPVFNSAISIIDDPYRIRGLGSRPFDAEGVRGAKHTLIEKGILKSWMMDVRSANQLGLQTTGNAARSLSAPPTPSSSNLYMENGTVSYEDLIGDVKDGFYITDLFGMGVNIVTGDYSQGASGFWIENGQISYPVSEITIAGNLKEMLMQATPANDLEFRYGTNAPTLRIERMTIAGT